MANVLMLGGGICGLGCALLLSRDGHDVTLLERDADPLPELPRTAWEKWDRGGVVQFRQPHNFMPGLRVILESELPDVQDALPRAGATKSTTPRWKAGFGLHEAANTAFPHPSVPLCRVLRIGYASARLTASSTESWTPRRPSRSKSAGPSDARSSASAAS